MKKLTGLLIDSDTQARLMLKSVVNTLPQFGEFSNRTSLGDALTSLATEQQIDVVFIASSFDKDLITQFIAQAKTIRSCQDAAFILILRSQDFNRATVASSMLSGTDGILVKPFSVDGLLEITHLAERVRHDRSKVRQRMGIKLLVSTMLPQLDELAYLKACGFEGRVTRRGLEETCSALQHLEPEDLQTYYDLLIEQTENLPAPRAVNPAHRYTGPSKRLKQKREEEIASVMKHKASMA